MEHARKGYRGQLDYSIPELDQTLASSQFQAYYPLNTVKDNSNPIQFNVSGNSAEFLDLFNSFIYFRVRVKNSDGSTISSGEKIAPANLFLHMLIKNCSLYLNNILVSDSSNYYAHSAWINAHLGLSQGVKTGQLTSELYYKDVDFDTNDPTNPSFKSRQDLAANSKIFEMTGKIQNGLFYQKRYLPPGVNFGMVLTRNSNEFALSSNVDSKSGVSGCPYAIYMEDCILYIRKHQLNPVVYDTVMRNSQKKFHFPINRSEIRSFALPIGSLGSVGEVMFNQNLPQMVIVGLVDSTAFSGKLTKSCVNFKEYNLTSINVTINDLTYRAFKPDFTNEVYLLAYRSLCAAEEDNSLGNYINREEFRKGSVLYTFDIRPSVANYFQTPQQGQVKVDLQFSKPLEQSLVAVVFGQFQSFITIESNGNVSIE